MLIDRIFMLLGCRERNREKMFELADARYVASFSRRKRLYVVVTKYEFLTQTKLPNATQLITMSELSMYSLKLGV
jgi:hypothetical protein